MKVVPATVASRSFAALLDEVEGGETVIVTRAGKRIATIGPAGSANGQDLINFFSTVSTDSAFATDVESTRALLDDDVAAWPES